VKLDDTSFVFASAAKQLLAFDVFCFWKIGSGWRNVWLDARGHEIPKFSIIELYSNLNTQLFPKFDDSSFVFSSAAEQLLAFDVISFWNIWYG
jgi:hypothetical protein